MDQPCDLSSSRDPHPPPPVLLHAPVPTTIIHEYRLEGPLIDAATIYPPIPAYSPPLTSPERLELSNYPAADNDVLRYTRAYGGGGVAVSRAQEAFPLDSLSLRSGEAPEPLPPYGANEPPRYRRRIENVEKEPQTLAMHFFKFGFFFPAFWVFGALMLITPLRSPDPLSQNSAWPPNTAFITWCNENIRTEEDKVAFLERMHVVEMKWAKRCLFALAALICFCVAIGVTIFGVLRASK